MPSAEAAAHKRAEAKELGFKPLDYPAITALPPLPEVVLFANAIAKAISAKDADTSLHLTSILMRTGQPEAARKLVQTAYEHELDRLATVEKDRADYQTQHSGVKFTRGFCEAGLFDRAEKTASALRNGDYLTRDWRLQGYIELARGHCLGGERKLGVELLQKMADGDGAASGFRDTMDYLPRVVAAALEVGELNIAKHAAMARDSKHDSYFRLSTDLRGAVAATLLAMNSSADAEHMFAKAVEGPDASVRQRLLKYYRDAALLAINDGSVIGAIEIPDRKYISTSWRYREMVGAELVEFYHRAGSAKTSEMLDAARNFSEAGFTKAPLAAFNHLLKDGRLLEAQDFLLSVEMNQLLHQQSDLWKALLVAGARADEKAIVKVSSTRVAENLDFHRYIGADGKLSSLSLTPLAAMHLALGNTAAAVRCASQDLLHERDHRTANGVLAAAYTSVLEGRFPAKEPQLKVFPICWLTMMD